GDRAASVPLSAHRQARSRADRGQPADEQNLEQPAVVVRINAEHQLDPIRPGDRDLDHEACYASGGKFGYDQSPAPRASPPMLAQLIDDAASDAQCNPPLTLGHGSACASGRGEPQTVSGSLAAGWLVTEASVRAIPVGQIVA